MSDGTHTLKFSLPGLFKIDRVILATLLVFLSLLIISASQAYASLKFVAGSAVFIAPLLALSVAIAAAARATDLDRQIGRVFSDSPYKSIVIAALFGAVSPFCSCGVIPIIASLLLAGVPLAPVTAFWLASPLMDPEMAIIMLADYDVAFILAKTASAVAIGATAGYLTHWLTQRRRFTQPLKENLRKSCSSRLDKAPIEIKFWRDRERFAEFKSSLSSNGFFLSKWLLLAFTLESLMVAYIPADAVARHLGSESLWSIPLSVVIGIPTYLNGYAAIPTVAALMDMGMLPGAALGFMLAGGITSIPAAMAVFSLVRIPVFAWYLTLGLSGSLICAYVFQWSIGL